MKMTFNEEYNKDSKDNEELKTILEIQIAITQWVQTVAILTEAVLLTKLYSINDECTEGEEKILAGIWTKAFGQLLEVLGVSQEISTTNKISINRAQKTAITGEFIQSLGSVLQAIGGIEELEGTDEDIIIP